MKKSNEEIEQYRVTKGMWGSDVSYGNNGAFEIPYQSFTLMVIASDEGGWEHVSVSLKNRTPNWKEMCFIKDLFWSEDEAVVQFHPPKSEYVNMHPNCLHLWKKVEEEFELPPSIFVGLKND